MKRLLRALILLAFSLHFWAPSPSAKNDPSIPYIRAGAIELGLSGSLTTVEGLSRGLASVRGGTFLSAINGLVGFEAELSYSHVQSLDRVDVLGHLSWQRAVGRSSVYPYVAIGGGIRKEWIGSFRQVRVPLGFSLGLRALLSQRVAFRTEYRFLRVMSDPISNFSEHQLTIGLSIFFRNST